MKIHPWGSNHGELFLKFEAENKEDNTVLRACLLRNGQKPPETIANIGMSVNLTNMIAGSGKCFVDQTPINPKQPDDDPGKTPTGLDSSPETQKDKDARLS